MAIGFVNKKSDEYNELYNEGKDHKLLRFFTIFFVVLSILSALFGLGLKLLAPARTILGLFVIIIWLIVVGLAVICTFFTVLLLEDFKEFSRNFRGIGERLMNGDAPVYEIINSILPISNVVIGLIGSLALLLSVIYHKKINTDNSKNYMITSIICLVLIIASMFINLV